MKLSKCSPSLGSIRSKQPSLVPKETSLDHLSPLFSSPNHCRVRAGNQTSSRGRISLGIYLLFIDRSEHFRFHWHQTPQTVNSQLAFPPGVSHDLTKRLCPAREEPLMWWPKE